MPDVRMDIFSGRTKASLWFIFSLGNRISADTAGGDWAITKKEPTFNLGEITKGRGKTALDGRMPLGRLCCYYVGRGC